LEHRERGVIDPQVLLTDRRDCRDDFTELQLVQDGGLSGGVQTNHQNSHLLLAPEAIEQLRERETHLGGSLTRVCGRVWVVWSGGPICAWKSTLSATVLHTLTVSRRYWTTNGNPAALSDGARCSFRYRRISAADLRVANAQVAGADIRAATAVRDQ